MSASPFHRPKHILLRISATAALIGSAASALAGSGFALEGQVIASGGTTRARSACFTLSATIGEPTAGSIGGANYSVVSGFWAAPIARTDELFGSNFEGCQP